MMFIIIWAAGKFFSSLLSLFYELTTCFYVSFRLMISLQPQTITLYAQLHTPPLPTTVDPCEQGGQWSGN